MLLAEGAQYEPTRILSVPRSKCGADARGARTADRAAHQRARCALDDGLIEGAG